jgi:hypothetical protein
MIPLILQFLRQDPLVKPLKTVTPVLQKLHRHGEGDARVKPREQAPIQIAIRINTSPLLSSRLNT